MEEDKNISVEDTGSQTTTVAEEKTSSKTLTQDEVDRIVQDRLAKAMEKAEQEKQEAVAKATELAQLDSQEREKKLAEMHEQEMMEKDRALSLRENKLEAIDILSKSNIPVNLVDYVVDVDKNKTIDNTNNFVKLFNEQVSLAVAEKLKGEAPKDITINENTKSTPSYRKVI